MNPMEDKRYADLVTGLRKAHARLLELPKDLNTPEISTILAELRLGANLLFAFINKYYDTLTDMQLEVAKLRQGYYEQALADGKSPNGAEILAREQTRIDEAEVKVIENRITQMKNEYERYNGICIFLQGKIKEMNTERMLG